MEVLAPKQVHEVLLKLHKDSLGSNRAEERWVAEFKCDRTSFKNYSHDRRPKVHQHQKGISLGNISNILTEILSFRNFDQQFLCLPPVCIKTKRLSIGVNQVLCFVG